MTFGPLLSCQGICCGMQSSKTLEPTSSKSARSSDPNGYKRVVTKHVNESDKTAGALVPVLGPLPECSEASSAAAKFSPLPSPLSPWPFTFPLDAFLLPESEKDDILPPSPLSPIDGYEPFSSEQDYSGLKAVMYRLHESQFYFEDLSSRQAIEKLKDRPVGSFLLRNSADPKHLFSLSLKTARGATSVRIEYKRGKFCLDCEDCLKQRMPKFDCVIELIERYVNSGERGSNSHKRVWLDSSGRRDLPVKLSHPVRQNTSSLKHLCRTTISGSLEDPVQDIPKLPLPHQIKKYLSLYPYSL